VIGKACDVYNSVKSCGWAVAVAFADFVRGVTSDYLYDVQLLIVGLLRDGAVMLRMQPGSRNKLVFRWCCS
jgi:hypothetical protein